ncbi:hypothetical protein LTS15_003911 [Exophiala xenobiotica]|nr:hypothetical protein LTS15_003911 [Exophiala xenobiotica]
MVNLKKAFRHSKTKLTSSILKATRTSRNLLRGTWGQSSATHSRFLIDASSGRASNETSEPRSGSHLSPPPTDPYSRQQMLDHLDGSYEDTLSLVNHSGTDSPRRTRRRRRVVIRAGPHAPVLPPSSPDTPAPFSRAETVESSSIPSDLASPNLADSPRSLVGFPRRSRSLMQRHSRRWVRNRVSAPSLIVFAQEPAYYLPRPYTIETTDGSNANKAPAPQFATEAGKTPTHHAKPSVSNSVQAQFFAPPRPEMRDAATQTTPPSYRDQGTQMSPPPSPPSPRYLSSGGSSADTFGELSPMPRNPRRRPRYFVRCIGRGIDQDLSPPPQPDLAPVVRFPPAQSESVAIEPVSLSEGGELSAGTPIILLSPPGSEGTPSLVQDITDEAPSSDRPWDDTDFDQFENDNDQRLVRIASQQWAVQPPQPTANVALAAANAASGSPSGGRWSDDFDASELAGGNDPQMVRVGELEWGLQTQDGQPGAANNFDESPAAARWSDDYDEFSSVENQQMVRVGDLEWRFESEDGQAATHLLDETPPFESARFEIWRRRSRPHAQHPRVPAAAPTAPTGNIGPVTPVQAFVPPPAHQNELGPHGLNYLTPHQVLLPGEVRGEWNSPRHDDAVENHPFAAVQRLSQAANFAAQQLEQLYREREAYRHNNNVNCWKVNQLQEELTRRHHLQQGTAPEAEMARLNQQLGEREAENRFLRIRLDQLERATAQAEEDSVHPGEALSVAGTVLHHQRPSQQLEEEEEDSDMYGPAPEVRQQADDPEQVVPVHETDSFSRDDEHLYQQATGGQVYESEQEDEEEVEEPIYRPQPECEDADVEDNHSTDTEPFPSFHDI